MAQRRRTTRSSARSYDDHEVLHPPHRLAKALATAGARRASTSAPSPAPRRRLAALAVEFSAWMRNEIKVLDAARDIVRERRA